MTYPWIKPVSDGTPCEAEGNGCSATATVQYDTVAADGGDVVLLCDSHAAAMLEANDDERRRRGWWDEDRAAGFRDLELDFGVAHPGDAGDDLILLIALNSPWDGSDDWRGWRSLPWEGGNPTHADRRTLLRTAVRCLREVPPALGEELARDAAASVGPQPRESRRLRIHSLQSRVDLISFIEDPTERGTNIPFGDGERYERLYRNRLAHKSARLAAEYLAVRGYDLPALLDGPAPASDGEIDALIARNPRQRGDLGEDDDDE